MQDGRARPALLHVPHRGGQWPASGTRVPRKEFLNERMHTCAQLCPLWVLPAGVPFSAPSVLTPFSSIIATPASPGAPPPRPSPSHLVPASRPLAVELHFLHQLVTHLVGQQWEPVHVWARLRMGKNGAGGCLQTSQGEDRQPTQGSESREQKGKPGDGRR